MPVTVGVNMLSVVHAGSNGITTAFPDVCKTPAPPAPPIPIPYPNIAQSSDSASTASSVTADGNPICVKDSNFRMSTGDEPGSLYYQLKTSKLEAVVDPYWFTYTGSNKRVLETSICVPLVKDNKFLGLFGFDIELSRYQ